MTRLKEFLILSKINQVCHNLSKVEIGFRIMKVIFCSLRWTVLSSRRSLNVYHITRRHGCNSEGGFLNTYLHVAEITAREVQRCRGKFFVRILLKRAYSIFILAVTRAVIQAYAHSRLVYFVQMHCIKNKHFIIFKLDVPHSCMH